MLPSEIEELSFPAFLLVTHMPCLTYIGNKLITLASLGTYFEANSVLALNASFLWGHRYMEKVLLIILAKVLYFPFTDSLKVSVSDRHAQSIYSCSSKQRAI